VKLAWSQSCHVPDVTLNEAALFAKPTRRRSLEGTIVRRLGPEKPGFAKSVISFSGAPDAAVEKTVIANSRTEGASNLLIDLPFLTRRFFHLIVPA
jgi:hypothetical protein